MALELYNQLNNGDRNEGIPQEVVKKRLNELAARFKTSGKIEVNKKALSDYGTYLHFSTNNQKLKNKVLEQINEIDSSKDLHKIKANLINIQNEIFK